MKRPITLVLLLFATAFTTAKAQQGEIIYREFSPSLAFESYDIHQTGNGNDTLRLEIDFDNDGTWDHIYYLDFIWHAWQLNERNLNGWTNRRVLLEEGDTLIANAPQGWLGDNGVPVIFIGELGVSPWNAFETYGICKTIDGKNYYGWYHCYGFDLVPYPGTTNTDRVMLYIDKIAFCTVPDYPLRWGQTSLDTDVAEDSSKPFATLHPNPTTGLLTVKGNLLLCAEVFNVLGQKVASNENHNGQLTLDIGSLPPGVYLVSVTNSEGKTHTEKIVKQ